MGGFYANEQSGGGGTILGSGTLNYVAKFTPDGTTIGNSVIFDDGTNVGFNKASSFGGKYHFAGTSNQVQFVIQAHASQTVGNPLFRFLKSDGSTLLDITSDDVTNIFIGLSSGSVNNLGGGGIDNTALGYTVLSNNTTGSQNTGVGKKAVLKNTTGIGNTGIGAGAVQENTTGISLTGVGYHALLQNTTGQENTAVGVLALGNNTTGGFNSAFGVSSLQNQTTPFHNSAFGYQAGISITTASYNSAFGGECLWSNQTGARNSAFGQSALYNARANNSTAIGYQAGYTSQLGNNVFLGAFAGYYETADQKLYIDNTTRTDEADGRLKALVYGVFNASVINQRFNVNGTFKVQPQDNVTEEKNGNTVNTTDATQTTLQTIAIPVGGTTITTTINYKKTAGAGTGTVGDSGCFIITQSFKNVAGTVTSTGALQNDYTTTPIGAEAATLDISGTNVRVRVTGIVNDDFTWNSISTVTTV